MWVLWVPIGPTIRAALMIGLQRVFLGQSSSRLLMKRMQSKLIIFLSVPVPVATILGESEIYLDAGSTINITCVVKHTPVPPSHVQWEHQGKVK